MRHSYWISWQFQMPDRRNGFGSSDIFTDAPLQAKDMGELQNWVRKSMGEPTASIVILSISKFKS